MYSLLSQLFFSDICVSAAIFDKFFNQQQVYDLTIFSVIFEIFVLF